MSDFLEKVKNLPPEINTFFSSNDPRLELERSVFAYNADEKEIGKLAGPVGLIFVGDIRLADLPNIVSKYLGTLPNISHGIAYEINRRIFNKFPNYFKDSPQLMQQWESLKSSPVLSEDQIQQKLLALEPWILEAEKEKQQKQSEERLQQQRLQDSLIKTDLRTALQQYPEIGDQIIGTERLKLKNAASPVIPSVKNWLSDYTFTMGHDKHDSIQRGQYMFQGENAKRLNNLDRQKLSMLLKALDESDPITVNKDQKTIVFETAVVAPLTPKFSSPAQSISNKIDFNNRPEPKAAPAPPKPPITENIPAGKISFSSSQKLPYEKINRQPFRIDPVFTKKDAPTETNNGKTLPKNVVNLKETDN